MSASNAFETALLALIFTNQALPNLGDAGGLQPSATAGVFYVSLSVGAGHEESDDQTHNEAAYTNYLRQSIARSAAAWTVIDDTADNDIEIAFPSCGGSGASLVGFGLGSSLSGSGAQFLIGELASPMVVTNGKSPTFAPGALDVTCF